MYNYPFPSPPVFISNYRFEMNLTLLNRILFHTVFIGYNTHKVLTFICNGIILPLCCVLTCTMGYKVLRVAWMKHVRKFETTLLCYAFIEIMVMQILSTSFALYYWTWGAVEYEETYGTSRFTCIFYLYFFNYLPSFCFNLVNCTISLLILVYYRKLNPTFCCLTLSNFNLRTLYVLIANGALCDVFFIFIISWITMVKASEVKDYQHKCFVLLNPIFHRLKITDWIKGAEWETQIFGHTVPYFFCVGYMVFAVYKVLQHHLNRRRGIGLQLREKQHYGGTVVTLILCSAFLIVDSLFNLYCDIYEISLHYTKEPTNAEFFFFLKDCRTVMRTIYFFLSPFQLLALCSLSPDFQSTMVRSLNGTEKFEVIIQKTIGGATLKKVLYEPLPEKLGFFASLYAKYTRCYCAVWLWRKFLDFFENSKRNRRQQKRQRQENVELASDMKTRDRNPSRNREARINIENSNAEGIKESDVLLCNRKLEIEQTVL